MEREKKREKKENSEEWEKSYTRDDLPSSSMVSPSYGIFLSYKFPPCPLINIYPSPSPPSLEMSRNPYQLVEKTKSPANTYLCLALFLLFSHFPSENKRAPRQRAAVHS
ncbi:hypothetical protein L873DRAFT_1339542 [Choiromyces venosus 120613-1]|uniref:Uncharacterized protein n=1 Tax=Choiromyces venosus 120613-1 TaxID=1336337 RepID=A0A3N4JEK9_9PEZI|nr:hypothetical protein L873DRAFT_1339542 [Choiromyces venosus 120613-1]